MLNKLKKLFDWFKDAGIRDNLPLGLKLRIRMTNIISVFILVTGMLAIAILNLSGLQEKILLELELFLSYGLVIVLNYSRYYNFSRIAFVVFTNILMFYIACVDSTNTGNSFYFFLLPLGTLIVFDVTERLKIIICLVISLSNYLVTYFFDFSKWIPPQSYNPQLLPFINYVSFFIYLVLISIMSYFFVSGNRVINNELINEQKRFDDLERLAQVGSWRLNLPSATITASNELLKIFDYRQTPNPLITLKAFFKRIHPDDRRNVYKSIQEVVNTGQFSELSYRIVLPLNKIRYVKSRAMIDMNSDEKQRHIDGALINITRQVETRNRLAQHLKEKEILLAEMHHRVKNNLAVISGLIQLQAFKVDPEPQLQFLEIHNKITTIALIHEKFYQSESLTKINLVNFVSELEKQIGRSIPVADCKIITQYKIDDIYLTINNAIPAALILNELITNSYKHAFQGMKEGKINIKIQRNDDSFILHYKDNGRGMPAGVDFNDSNNQGLSLINMLAKSMNFEFTTTNQNGLYFTMYKTDQAKNDTVK